MTSSHKCQCWTRQSAVTFGVLNPQQTTTLNCPPTNSLLLLIPTIKLKNYNRSNPNKHYYLYKATVEISPKANHSRSTHHASTQTDNHEHTKAAKKSNLTEKGHLIRKGPASSLAKLDDNSIVCNNNNMLVMDHASGMYSWEFSHLVNPTSLELNF